MAEIAAVLGNWGLGHWGLDRNPFAAGSRAFFHRGAPQAEALARMHYVLEGAEGAALLTGCAGTGKSRLLAELACELVRSGSHVVQLSLKGVAPEELPARLLAKWGTANRGGGGQASPWRIIAQRIREQHWQRQPCVILLDDLDDGPAALAEPLERLIGRGSSTRDGVRLAVAVQELEACSWSSGIREHIPLRIELDPWEARDTDSYLHAVLASAGRAERAFTAAASGALHVLTGGIPALVAPLAERALSRGATAGADCVTEAIVRESAQDSLPIGEYMADDRCPVAAASGA